MGYQHQLIPLFMALRLGYCKAVGVRCLPAATEHILFPLVRHAVHRRGSDVLIFLCRTWVRLIIWCRG